MPYSSASATSHARRVLEVKKYAASPYSVSLAMRTPSASVSKGNIGATGPNVSSWYTTMSSEAPLSTVGWKNWGPAEHLTPPVSTSAPLPTASATC
eukprot:CAMPEP_0182872396 /NCGR_PEP_ID=MMETSP0034_2-20130328/11684_1 /TAXON_ID=156128 /ORGANISM="Nephroselmis pyriformis, Strain CCMP717" /LENGTH=95 /DNA_ID=CAMNT_0025004987 /DNA_START=40 /DNA_END=324 /DNA_ORIENTATION=+